MAAPVLSPLAEAAGEEAVRQTVTLTVIEGGAGAAEAGGAVLVAGEATTAVAAGEVAAGGAAAAGIGGAAIATAGIALVVIGLVALGYYLYTRSKAAGPSPAAPDATAGPTPTPKTIPVPAPNSPPVAQCLPQSGRGPCGPKCDDLLKQISEAMDVLRARIEELLEDKLDLYHKAYDTPNPALPPNSGTWLGHIEAADGWQNRVGNLIDELLENGCPVPPDAWRLATRKLPSQPRGN